MLCSKLADIVINEGYDGIDLDTNSFELHSKGLFKNWIINCTEVIYNKF